MDYLIRLTRIDERPFSQDAIERHVARLRELDDAGRLIAAGPLADGTGGLVLATFDSDDAAQAWAADEPFATDGYETAEALPWIAATRANDYLLRD